ncbi:MAG: hypothetical protein JWN86_2516 [Planctomycetota bacterium]|nr:hypothetical protein [Planctomycetota bacterium]
MEITLVLRQHPRFAVWGWGAWIEWQDGDRGCGSLMELINISPGGAMVLSPMLPRVGQAVTFRIEGLTPRFAVSAVVVGTQPGWQDHQVHLEFRVPCPIGLLAAVLGEHRPDVAAWDGTRGAEKVRPRDPPDPRGRPDRPSPPKG